MWFSTGLLPLLFFLKKNDSLLHQNMKHKIGDSSIYSEVHICIYNNCYPNLKLNSKTNIQFVPLLCYAKEIDKFSIAVAGTPVEQSSVELTNSKIEQGSEQR